MKRTPPPWPASIMAMVNGLQVLEACGVIKEEEYMTIRKRIVDYDDEQELKKALATGDGRKVAKLRKSFQI
jgi:hypothetical protein